MIKEIRLVFQWWAYHKHSAQSIKLLLAKLEAISFPAKSLELLHKYLSNQFQRTHINGVFSNMIKISKLQEKISNLNQAPNLTSQFYENGFIVDELFECV